MTTGDRYSILLLEQHYWGEESFKANEAGDKERADFCNKMFIGMYPALDVLALALDDEEWEECEPVACKKCGIKPTLSEDEIFGGWFVICPRCEWVNEGGDEESAIEQWNEAHGGKNADND